MKNHHIVPAALAALAFLVLTSVAWASSQRPLPTTTPAEIAADAPPLHPPDPDSPLPTATLAETVRQATAPFKDVKAAGRAGYGLLHGCVSGPQNGAMGIHFANGKLVGDGMLDVLHPEALLYEQKDGKLDLLGVEYLVLADAWDAKHDAPPTLMGQMFNYVSTPNRYRLPGFYELHVWAWKSNPDGVFADWNPTVSCEQFVGDPAM